MMIKDTETVAALATKTLDELSATFWNHPTNMTARNAPGTDVGPAMSAMAIAAVDVFLNYVQSVLVTTGNDNKPVTYKRPTTTADHHR